MAKPMKFQIQLSGQWQDYGAQEDAILKRAFLAGLPKAKFHLRGQDYEYDFSKMVQINSQSGKERPIRPPPRFKPPPAPIVPPGPVICIVIPPNPQPMMMVPHPQSPGEQIQVQVPPGAKPGQNMMVPVPPKGGMGMAGKAAAGVGAVGVVGGMAVAGAILGDMAAGGELGAEGAVDMLGDAVVDGAADAGDWLGGVGEKAADFVMDLFA